MRIISGLALGALFVAPLKLAAAAEPISAIRTRAEQTHTEQARAEQTHAEQTRGDQADTDPIRAVRIHRAPRIDGRLDEDHWKRSRPATGFVNGMPVPGQPPSQPTEFWVAYDAERIYVAFRCHDSDPSQIRSRVARRDAAFDDDWVGLFLNGSGGAQGAAELFVNPHGSQMDALQTAQGDDVSVDYIYESMACRDAGGWSAEMAIPFKSLRFRGGRQVRIRLIAMRHISRTGEKALLPRLDVCRQGWQASGTPVVFEGIRQGRLIEVLPALTASAHSELRAGRMEEGAMVPELGLGLKYGLASDLTLDMTWRPDFSQVEADVSQVEANRRFPVHYPEKRPFFLEGRELFVLAAEGWGVGEVFHSRTIQSPRFGVKATGHLGRGCDIGALVVSDRVSGLDRWGSGSGEEDGGALAGVLRCRRRLAGNSVVGGYFSSLESAGSHNRVVGGDADLILSPVSRLGLHGLLSHTRDQSEAGLDGQFGGLWGYTGALVLSLRSKLQELEAAYAAVSPRFRLETGFLERSAAHTASLRYQLWLYPAPRWLNRVRPAVEQRTYWDWKGHETDGETRFWVGFDMTRQSAVRLMGIVAKECFEGLWFDQGGWKISAATGIVPGLHLQTSHTRRGATYYDPANPLQGRCLRTVTKVGLWPSDRVTLDLRYVRETLRARQGGECLYRVGLMRARLAFQPDRRLHLRAITEWNDATTEVTTDFLVSFTSIPGTVMHLGYGSIHQRETMIGEESGWMNGEFGSGNRFRTVQQDLFLKASYNYRF